MGCVGENTRCVLVYQRAAAIKVEVWEIIHCEIVAVDHLHDRGIQNGEARLDIVQPQPFINHSQPSLVGIQYLSSRERKMIYYWPFRYIIPKSPPHTVEDQIPTDEYQGQELILLTLNLLMDVGR